MIITRTPLRVSFFGGGTDYPAWFQEHGGAVLATTIDKYLYLHCRHLPPFFDFHSRIVWSRIEAVIGGGATTAPGAPSLWQSLAFWKSFGIASAALAAASIAALAYLELAPRARAPLMATLGGAAGQPNFVAAITATGNNLVIVPAALLTNDPRAFELWLIPVGETRPRSLGLIQPGQPIKLEIPPDLQGRITPDATLAVSLEPPGGSPTGLPTGEVIAAGKLTSL